MSQEVDAEVVNSEVEREMPDSGALAILTKSEIDTQIATAKKYPRSVTKFVSDVRALACLSEDVAGACMYALKRGGKTIEGPSARFAEIVAHAWGNCRAGARVVAEDDRFVTAQGYCVDLEKNVAISYEVKRRIRDKTGRKYTDDMVGVTANAACSIALRNAVFKIVPKAFWDPCYQDARKTAVGDAQTLADRRTKMLQAFAKMGVTPDSIFVLMEVKGEEDITLEHLAVLRGLFTSIKDGETTVDDAFSKVPVEGGRVKRSGLNEKVAKGTGAPKKPAGPKQETAPAANASASSGLSTEAASPAPSHTDANPPAQDSDGPCPADESVPADNSAAGEESQVPPDDPGDPGALDGVGDALSECPTAAAVKKFGADFLASSNLTPQQLAAYRLMESARLDEIKKARGSKPAAQGSLLPSDGGEAYGR